MKMLFLTLIFVFLSQILTAPTIGMQLRFQKFREASEIMDSVYYESEFTRFIEDLGYRESKNNWKSVNCVGCFGEWQFAESTVHYLGFKQITLRKFKKDPDIFPRELQRKALENLIKVNLALLKDYEQFIGDTIKGIVVTKAGLIAASHLGGAGTTKAFLNSRGKVNRKDVLGTSIYDYMKRFCYYDLK